MTSISREILNKSGERDLAEEDKVNIGEKKQDVVIIGAGMAGFVAAIERVPTVHRLRFLTSWIEQKLSYYQFEGDYDTRATS